MYLRGLRATARSPRGKGVVSLEDLIYRRGLQVFRDEHPHDDTLSVLKIASASARTSNH
jgi:hypothetical protein